MFGLPMMGADFMHNKWISENWKIRFVHIFPLLLLYKYELLENLNSNVVDVWYFYSKFKYQPRSILLKS